MLPIVAMTTVQADSILRKVLLGFVPCYAMKCANNKDLHLQDFGYADVVHSFEKLCHVGFRTMLRNEVRKQQGPTSTSCPPLPKGG